MITLLPDEVEKSAKTNATAESRISLGRLAALLARCDAVVSNNTGPLHMAAALGRPVAALMRPTPQYLPWGTRCVIPQVALPEGMDDEKEREAAYIRGITVAQAAAGVRELLKG